MRTPKGCNLMLGNRRHRRSYQQRDTELCVSISPIINVSGWKCRKYLRDWLYLNTKGYHLSVRVNTIIINNQNTVLHRKWSQNSQGNRPSSLDFDFCRLLCLIIHRLHATVAPRHNWCSKHLRAYTQVTMCQENTVLQGWWVSSYSLTNMSCQHIQYIFILL